MSIEFHVKCRDAFQQLADTHNEEIERRTPPEVKYGEKDFEKLKWYTKEGTKGSYKQTTKEANNNNEVFQALQNILKDRSGFWQSTNYKFWVHSGNPNIIDKRRKEKTQAQTPSKPQQSLDPHERMDQNLANIKQAGEKLTQAKHTEVFYRWLSNPCGTLKH